MQKKVGSILVAHPNMNPKNSFAQTVIYLYEDNSKMGTIGLVVNKPSRYTINDLCVQMKIGTYPYDHKVYRGGPLAERNLLLLHTDEWSSTNTIPIGDGYAITSDTLMLEKLMQGNHPTWFRLCSGISSWAPGQLDMELKGQYPYTAENSWLTGKATDAVLFGESGEKQWQEALDLCSAQMIDKFF